VQLRALRPSSRRAAGCRSSSGKHRLDASRCFACSSAGRAENRALHGRSRRLPSRGRERARRLFVLLLVACSWAASALFVAFSSISISLAAGQRGRHGGGRQPVAGTTIPLHRPLLPGPKSRKATMRTFLSLASSTIEGPLSRRRIPMRTNRDRRQPLRRLQWESPLQLVMVRQRRTRHGRWSGCLGRHEKAYWWHSGGSI